MMEKAKTVKATKGDMKWGSGKMQKIVPFIWFNGNAEDAVKFYKSVFRDFKINETSYYGDGMHQPAGTVLTIMFEISGYEIGALNAGPEFKPTPALSFSVACKDKAEIDGLWKKLSAGGNVMMPIDKYPFSERYGWLSDKYGVSWQLNMQEAPSKVRPSLLFVGKQFGKADEAMKFYTSLFDDSKIGMVARYDENMQGPIGKVAYAEFTLAGQEFVAMESDLEHNFTFTEGLSLMVNCETQEEIDRLWDKLGKGGEFQVCGWLKDKYGVSWQITPAIVGKYLTGKDKAAAQRVMDEVNKMKKLDMKRLEEAYKGK